MIQPYYQDDHVTLYNADCRDVLPQLSDIGLLFADPPFNVGKKYGGSASNDRREDYYEWCAEWISAGFDALADDGSFYLMTIPRHLEMLYPIMGAHGVFINHVNWKNVSANHNGRGFWEACQPILVYGKTEKFHFSRYAEVAANSVTSWSKSRALREKGQLKDFWDDIAPVYAGSIAHPEAVLKRGTRQKAHPCQMPLSLAGRAMAFSLPPGKPIVDCFAGSGTTLVAAKKANVPAVGIELQREYCDIAVERLRQNSLIPLMEAA